VVSGAEEVPRVINKRLMTSGVVSRVAKVPRDINKTSGVVSGAFINPHATNK